MGRDFRNVNWSAYAKLANFRWPGDEDGPFYDHAIENIEALRRIFPADASILVLGRPGPLWTLLPAHAGKVLYAHSNETYRKVFSTLLPSHSVLDQDILVDLKGQFDVVIVSWRDRPNDLSTEDAWGYGDGWEKFEEHKRDVEHPFLDDVKDAAGFSREDGILITVGNVAELLSEGLEDGRINGLRLAAILAASDRPTYHGKDVLIFTATDIDAVFIGLLSSDENQQKKVVNNYLNDRIGGSVTLGRKETLAGYMPIAKFRERENYEQAAKRSGDKLIPIEDLVKLGGWFGPLLPEYVDEENLKDLEASVFIDQESRLETVTAWPGAEPHPFPDQGMVMRIQVVLRADKMLPEYFAQVLNGELGKLLLASSSKPDKWMRTKLDRDLFLGSQFPTADLAEQQRRLTFSRKVEAVSTEVGMTKRKLWMRPGSWATIEKDFRLRYPEPGPDEWIEVLPFPLASILKGYYAKAYPNDRLERLLHFFEGLSQYLSTLFLSVLASDRQFYQKNWAQIIGWQEERQTWIRTATFAGWNHLLANLNKAIRRYANEPDTVLREQVGVRNALNDDVINHLAAPFLHSALEELGERRNTWKAHAGAVSRKHQMERLEELAEYLAVLKDTLQNGFHSLELYRAGKMEFSNPGWDIETQVLGGSNPQFREVLFASPEVVTGGLFSHTEGAERIVKLLPLIQLRHSLRTETDVVYFYNRLNTDGQIRMISYYYEQDGDITITDVGVLEALSLIDPTLRRDH
jgi:hypothetical protein